MNLGLLFTRMFSKNAMFCLGAATLIGAFAHADPPDLGNSRYYVFSHAVPLYVFGGEPANLQLQPGQIVVIDPKNPVIQVTLQDGTTVQARILEDSMQFASPLLDSNAKGEALVAGELVVNGKNVIRYAPQNIGDIYSNGKTVIAVEQMQNPPRVRIQSTQVVDVGTPEKPNFQLIQTICFNDFQNKKHCGYTTANDVRQEGLHASGSAVQVQGRQQVTTNDANWWIQHDLYEKKQEAKQIAAERGYLIKHPEMPTIENPRETAAFLNCKNRTTVNDDTNNVLNGVAASPVIKELNSGLGLCTASESTSFKGMKHVNIYDKIALLPVIHHFKDFPKNIRKSDGTALTKQNILDMDVLARTIYGEMSSCAVRDKKGEVIGAKRAPREYKEAVACVILNRAAHSSSEETEDAQFISGAQSKLRTSPISRAALAYHQFSMWNYPEDENSKILLDRALCPRVNTDSWQEARNVAMAAILDPVEMKSKCQNVKTDYYTSHMRMPWSSYWGFNEVKPYATIDGKPLADPECIRLWNKFQR